MAKPVESIIKAVLSKNGRNAKLMAAVEYGWARAKAHPDHLSFRRKSTRAALVWEGTVAKAIELFVGDTGVSVVKHFDTVSFIFDEIVFLRFKKGDHGLHTANYPTMLAEAYHEQGVDLFGFEGHQRVEVVHVLNQYETEIAWIGVVARDNAEVDWNFELADEVKPMTLHPASQKKSTAGLAKLKDPTVEKKKKNKGQ